jgi:hypothetical protein
VAKLFHHRLLPLPLVVGDVVRTSDAEPIRDQVRASLLKPLLSHRRNQTLAGSRAGPSNGCAAVHGDIGLPWHASGLLRLISTTAPRDIRLALDFGSGLRRGSATEPVSTFDLS